MLSAETKGNTTGETFEIQNIAIPKGIVVDKVVFYIVQIVGTFNSWTIQKRYSQFEKIYDLIDDKYGHLLPAGTDLPPKKLKLFTSHLSNDFIEQRRILLESFIKKLTSVEQIVSSKRFKKFITSDKVDAENDKKVNIIDIKSEIEANLPDDVEITGITIPSTRTMSDHVLYQIDVENVRKRKSYSKWTVLKRFGQFFEMDTQLRNECIDNVTLLSHLPKPPQRKVKILNDHMDDTFIEQRRVLLENYLLKLLRHVEVVRSPTFLSFCGV